MWEVSIPVKFLIRAIAAVMTVGLLYGAYQWVYPTYSYRFRIVIEVDTPQGVKSGSSVLQVTTVQYPRWLTLGANSTETWVRGEAVFVDLNNGRAVMGLLAFGQEGASTHVADVPVQAFLQTSSRGRGYQPEWTRSISRVSENAILTGAQCPLLLVCVKFEDPRSCQIADASELASALGEGFAFRRSWIEVTQLPITRRLKGSVPWVGSHQEALSVWRQATSFSRRHPAMHGLSGEATGIFWR